MIFTKIAVTGGIVLLGFLCFLAANGMTAVTEGLVTVFALVILVAGGNLLSGRSGYGRKPAGGSPASGDPAVSSSQDPPHGTEHRAT